MRKVLLLILALSSLAPIVVQAQSYEEWRARKAYWRWRHRHDDFYDRYYHPYYHHHPHWDW